MMPTKIIRNESFAAVVILLLFCCTSIAAAKTAALADKWQYELAIYGWLPSIDGTLKYGLPPEDGGSVGVDASSILDSLNFVFMGNGVARRNKLLFSMDVIYMDVSNSKNVDILVGPDPGLPLGVNAGLGLKAWLVTGVAGYEMVQTDRSRMAIVGGLRYLNMDADLDVTITGPLPQNPPPAHVSGSEDYWDGIIGVRGAFMLNEHWYIPYYADIGTGNSQATWQLYTAIGYQFHWGGIALG